jgi:hypothetical protein
LEQHIDERHSQEISSNQIKTVIEQSRRPIEFIQPSECPFCDDEWVSAEPSAIPAEETLVVDVDEFRRHLGHHLQQVALFSLPRLNQDQEMDSNHVVGFPDRDAMPAGYRWVRDDCGRGWSIISGRRATFIALAFFLAKYRMKDQTARSHFDPFGPAPVYVQSPWADQQVRVTLESSQHITLVVAFNITYQSLVDRIDAKLSHFTTSSIHNGTLKLGYRDEDGDLVAIEDDDDLQIVFMEWHRKFLSVYYGGAGEIELFCVGDIS